MKRCNHFGYRSRRELLQDVACGFGGLALASLLNGSASARAIDPRLAPIAPKAKRIIFLFMAGGVSHVDSFDYKPELAKQHGKTLKFRDARTLANKGVGLEAKLMQSLWKFRQRGETGKWASDLF